MRTNLFFGYFRSNCNNLTKSFESNIKRTIKRQINPTKFMQKKKHKFHLRFDTRNIFTIGKVDVGSIDTNVKVLY